MIDHFWRLRLPWTATDDDIRAAYHRLALDVHPDRAPAGASARERARCTKAMARLNESYAVLEDPARRAGHRSALERQRATRTKAIPRRPPPTTAPSHPPPSARPADATYRRPAPRTSRTPTTGDFWQSPFDHVIDRVERVRSRRSSAFALNLAIRVGPAIVIMLVRACAPTDPAPHSTPSEPTVVSASAAPTTSGAPGRG